MDPTPLPPVGSESGKSHSVPPWSPAFLLRLSDREEVDAIKQGEVVSIEEMTEQCPLPGFHSRGRPSCPPWSSLLGNTPTTPTTPLACINVFGISGCYDTGRKAQHPTEEACQPR